MGIETEVLESAIEVILPMLATGAGEETGAALARTAAQSATVLGGLVVDRVIGRLRDQFGLGRRSTKDEVRRALAELSLDPEAARDLVVLAGSRIQSADRDFYQIDGDATISNYEISTQSGDVTSVGEIRADRSAFHFGSKRDRRVPTTEFDRQASDNG